MASAEPRKKKTNRPKGLTLGQQVSIVLGSGTLVAAAIGAYLVVTNVNAAPPTPNVASTAVPTDHSGAIVVKNANGVGCHRMKFNNATGAITDDGAVPCPVGSVSTGGGLSGNSEAQIARFGQISNGFKH